MFESGSARYGWISVPLLFAAVLSGCDAHKEASPEQVAEFKYCSGFTAAAERAAYKGVIDLETAGNLRAGQVDAGNRLLLPPEEMSIKADGQGEPQAATTTEVGRGLEEGHAMIDKNQRQELLDKVHSCSQFFATLVK